MRFALPLLLVACDAQVDFTVDASTLAADEPGLTLRVDLVAGGEASVRENLDLDEVSVLTFPDAIQVGVIHGIVAYADRDGDGACSRDADHTWVFEYVPAYNEDFVWEVDPDELLDGAACQWFGDEEPGLPPGIGDTGT